jgi:hypothetical protein
MTQISIEFDGKFVPIDGPKMVDVPHLPSPTFCQGEMKVNYVNYVLLDELLLKAGLRSIARPTAGSAAAYALLWKLERERREYQVVRIENLNHDPLHVEWPDGRMTVIEPGAVGDYPMEVAPGVSVGPKWKTR